jgi:GNAT superfamily N-acetyltransferase
MSDLELREESYECASAQVLIEAVQREYVDRYGSPDETPVDPGEFAPPGGRFVVGYLGAEPVAMGGLRRLDETTVEVKRMYVSPAHRGRGWARVVLGRLEELAREAGATRVVLETGSRQPEAMGLYESAGYSRIPGFGHYRCEPLSVSYGKNV